MRDWHFWTFIACFYLLLGLITPFPFDWIFIAGAFGIGAFSHWVQKKEIENARKKRAEASERFAMLHQDLEEIKELLGKKRMIKNTKEVGNGNKQRRV